MKAIRRDRDTSKKIKSLEELSEILAKLRENNLTVVQCHGVFDLLHIGHIRHFEEARKLADIMVVTITPDVFVDKGPHRPAFIQELRAEAIAALDCIDYVAVNKWPTATETIKLLQPNYYVKGSDYNDKEGDITGGIKKEEEAISSVKGKLVLTDNITFSSSGLINEHIPVFSDDVKIYLEKFSSQYDSVEVLKYLEGYKDLRILVIGETIIDEYQYCDAIGKSSKEPTLAMKVTATERFAGGILAVGNHVSNFSDNVGLISYLGMKESQEEFVKKHVNPAINTKFIYKQLSPTIVKRRFVESYTAFKLLEIYEMNDQPLQEDKEQELCSILNNEIPNYDVVIVVDYGHGFLSPDAIKIICEKSSFLAINAQSNAANLGFHTVSKYPTADYICVTENELKLDARDKEGDVKYVIKQLSDKMDCSHVMVTRSRLGCLSYSDKEGFIETPALADHVVDRIGAGDAFLSLTAPCVAQNAPMEVVGFIGNAAGANAVATVGNRNPINRNSLLRHINSLLK